MHYRCNHLNVRYLIFLLTILPAGILTAVAKSPVTPVQNIFYPISLTNWQLTTDQILSGRSFGTIFIDNRTLRLKGRLVPVQNNAFLKISTPLSASRQGFNAAAMTGLQIQIKGTNSPLNIILHTASSPPNQFFQTIFTPKPQSSLIRLPFDAFNPYPMNRTLDRRHLKTVDIVARNGRDIDVTIENIGFYCKEPLVSNELTDIEKQVIINKATEPAGTGQYTDWFQPGLYLCKQCRTPLFESTTKFHSGCGWPSFDDAIPGRVKRQPDADGVRTEIVCAACGGHLGHVFEGENLTPKNTRHCVNSISLIFVPQSQVGMERAIFAAGCFWGVQHWLDKAPGVIDTQVGYTGGHVLEPTYKQVCTGKTGHAEAVEVVFDPAKTSFEALVKIFFETHDFTQLDRQGPDIGHQYRSEIFFFNLQQKQTAEKIIAELKKMGYDVKTALTPASRFWPAEDYHQDYYAHKGELPYCHAYKKIF